MALDWIKLDHATLTKPELMRIARSLGVPRPHVLGALMYVWSWLDEQTESDTVAGATEDDIDQVADLPGLAQEMQKVGWLEINSDGARFPRITEKYGATARKRALDARRAQKYRSREDGRHATVTHLRDDRAHLRDDLRRSSRTPVTNVRDSVTTVTHLRDQEQEQAQAQEQEPSTALSGTGTSDHSDEVGGAGFSGGGLVPAVPATPGCATVIDDARRRLRALQLLENSPIDKRFKRRAHNAIMRIEDSGRDPCAVVADVIRRSATAVKPGSWVLKALEREADGET